VRRRAATPVLSCLALLAAGLVTVAAAPDPARPLEGGSRERLVDVRLSMADGLPERTRTSLVQEAEAIWRREGVRIRWQAWNAPREQMSEGALPVLVVQAARGAREAAPHWRVGELLLDQANRPFAVASIEAAERVLAAGGADTEPVSLRQYRLGVILGRALAHEMGHYLLATPGHASRGLMRARIDASELADLRTGGFFLDADAARWIRDNGQSASAETRLARFDYQH
jgi:hypothetical protein